MFCFQNLSCFFASNVLMMFYYQLCFFPVPLTLGTKLKQKKRRTEFRIPKKTDPMNSHRGIFSPRELADGCGQLAWTLNDHWHGSPLEEVWLHSLKLTASLPLKIDGWKTILSFLWGRPKAYFQGRIVSFRKCHGSEVLPTFWVSSKWVFRSSGGGFLGKASKPSSFYQPKLDEGNLLGRFPL